MNSRRLMCLYVFLFVLSMPTALPIGHSVTAIQDTAGSPNWAQAREEAVRILSGLVKIDTSNPPGKETKAAEYIKAILDREGIPSQIFEGVPGRGNLVARLLSRKIN